MSTVARAKRAIGGVRVWLWADDAEGEFQALLSHDQARELLGQLAAALEAEEAPLPRHDPRPALPGRWNAPEGPAWGTPECLVCGAPAGTAHTVDCARRTEVMREAFPGIYGDGTDPRGYTNGIMDRKRVDPQDSTQVVINAAFSGFSKWTRVAQGRPPVD